MPASTPPPSSAPSGELLAGRYALDRRIGQGGMAEVWVATDIELDRKVAVKVLKSNLAADPVVAERFRREAVAVARLSHPNIVAVHDVCEHEGRQAVVMQLVDGKSLRQLLDTQKRLGPELTIHIGAAIAGALDEAHRGGFVHRDVKPGNIMVTSDARVLLTDFGIAKGLQQADEDLTSDNVMMGTAKYLSPEQVRGKRLDGRADLYSLGLVLYECLAGRVPFLGESDADTALARLQRDPTDLGLLRPTLPIGLVNLIHKTLTRNPAHRPQSGALLRSALLAVDTTPPHIDGTPAEPPARVANPPRQARGAGPGIPGEPHVTGAVPTTRRDTPTSSGSPQYGQRDVTPAAREPIRGAPARRDQQRLTPSLVAVGTLLAVALIVSLVLFVVVNQGDTADDIPTTTIVPGGAPSSDLTDDSITTTPPIVIPGEPRIVGISAWDPDGDNGSENDAQAPLALADGLPSTAWSTECYQDRFMGGKRGVGLIVNLENPALGTVSVDVESAPYALDVYMTTEAEAPAEFEAWLQVGQSAFADRPETVAVPIDAPATHLLLWLRELGEDDGCSDINPFRGRLGEVSYLP